MAYSPIEQNGALDPRGATDRIRLRTELTQAAIGGATFGTHRLEYVNSSSVAFKSTVDMKAFSGVFLVVGVAALIVGFWHVRGGDLAGLGLMVMFGAPFTIGGLLLFSKTGAPRQFDWSTHTYWKGRQKVSLATDRTKLKEWADLRNIYSLQIIGAGFAMGADPGTGGDGMSYELNLVFRDANRLNIVDHGDLTALRIDAQRLSAFLGNIPVWDATLAPPHPSSVPY